MFKPLILTTLCIFYITSYGQTSKNSSLTNNKNDLNYLDSIEVKNIGPSVFGARVVDLCVNPLNTSEFYVAYASGGLWHTTNNGTTFTPIFDNQAVITIGDIDVHWATHTIYLGSGEVNSSRSSYAGNGVYKSTNNGKTWEYLGLPESHHIGRVIIDPDNPNIVNLAVLGHLYTPNSERGMYRTSDGGKTWSQTLFINDNTGAIDLIATPGSDNNTLYCAMWERTRRAWNFTESGSGSGIYKSEDNGTTWKLISGTETGFPNGDGTGRIGLAVHTGSYETTVYALLDNYNRRPAENSNPSNELKKEDFEKMTTAQFIALKDKDLDNYLVNNMFRDYDAKSVKKMVADGKILPIALKEYVENANTLLFDTPVIGAEIYKLNNSSDTKWTKTHNEYIDGLYNSYGYYFGQIRVNPNDKNQLYIMGVPILRSDDGGKNWKNVNGANVHVDHHALWINPKNPKHIINGNDGGVNISYDSGENWIKCTSPPVGQFYSVNLDHSKEYKVYGGTQDNGVWVGDANYSENVRWQMTGSYPYNTIMGGDGMQVQIDNRDNTTVYTGYQYGNYFRINTNTGNRTYITPKHKLGDKPYRWNWQSPILLSPHHQDIVYFGANKLLRSMDQGESFKEISDDLTKNEKKGDVAFGTLTTISESPLQFGFIYTGSDDGNVFVTKNNGSTWTDISSGLPDSLWVSRVVASAYDKDRVYVAVNGYRNDIFDPFIYVSDDEGNTWKALGNALPLGPVNVIKEDPKNENILYVGTDNGAFISINQGLSFMKIGNLPNVPVHDIAVHKSSGDLIIGTHGRSIYKLNTKVLTEAIETGTKLTSSGNHEVLYSSRWGSMSNVYSEPFIQEYNFNVFSKTGGSGKLNIYAGTKKLNVLPVHVPMGVSTLSYDLSIDPKRKNDLVKHHNKEYSNSTTLFQADDKNYYLLPGTYELELEVGKFKTRQSFKIEVH